MRSSHPRYVCVPAPHAVLVDGDGAGALGAVFAASPLTGWRSRLYAIQRLRNAHPDWYRDDLGRLFALLRAQAIAPRVFRTMPLESAREALELVSGGRVEGKVILRA